jgi:hypothetical protein
MSLHTALLRAAHRLTNLKVEPVAVVGFGPTPVYPEGAYHLSLVDQYGGFASNWNNPGDAPLKELIGGLLKAGGRQP